MEYFASFGNLLAALVTAFATVFLWLVTRTLARETKRMAEASSRPHVVATIEANRWSMMHANIRVENTGTGTAYDTSVTFEPPLARDKTAPDREIPLQRISVLRPGQALTSYLSEFGPLLDRSYKVTITWLRDPAKPDRETHSYTLNLADIGSMTRLGAEDPLVQIAEETKHIRDDWRWVAGGSHRLSVDVFTTADRLHQRRQHERARRAHRQDSKERTGPETDTKN